MLVLVLVLVLVLLLLPPDPCRCCCDGFRCGAKIGGGIHSVFSVFKLW
jgi:hypothetical protein